LEIDYAIQTQIITCYALAIMTIIETLAALANIATAAAVVVGAWQLVLVHRLSVTNFENTFSKEYRELAAKLPTKALLGEEFTDDEHAKHFDEMYHYFDLCNEQAFLRSLGSRFRQNMDLLEGWN
jgi:hypothetical protein